jgi:hypothetical protein
MARPRNWRPGSFTKNFSWGKSGSGLSHLHHAIHVAFDGKLEDVKRDVARSRLKSAGINDFIPPNFFLMNIRNGESVIVADELVATTLSMSPGEYFDRLAVFALNLSMAGIWAGAQPEQRYPAEWAKYFIVSRVFRSDHWDSTQLNAKEIESFIASNPDYRGVWARKTATNLNYIYELAGMRGLRSGLAEPWWSSAIFLALDRISLDRNWAVSRIDTNTAIEALRDEHVFELTAVPLAEGLMAARELVEIYFGLGCLTRLRSISTAPSTLPTTTPSQPPVDGLEKEALPVERVYAMSSRQVRDRKIVAQARGLYQDKCCVCAQALPVGRDLTYSEIGHVKPVGLPFKGPDHLSNVLPFCPNHHRQFDRGSIYFEVDGRSATVVDRCHPSTVHGRTFTPVADHAFDMTNLKWHADFFLQR